MVQSIAEICIDKGIKLVDVPEFAYELAKNPIPFSTAKGQKLKSLNKNFNYEHEAKFAKYTINDIPEGLRDNLYEF